MVMGKRVRQGLALVALAATVPMLTGCGQIRNHRGYLFDAELASAISPGVDNMQSVTATLGRPSFIGQFDERDWYYYSRDTRQIAFGEPRPTEQRVLHVRFDADGNVETVENTGVELAVNINPENDKTPTLGRERSFFEDLFGNIGQIGAGGAGPAGPGGP